MTATPVKAATPAKAPVPTAPMDAETLRILAGKTGPCVTLLIPASRPGTLGGYRHTVMTELLKSAKAKLHAHKWCDESEDLLVPVREFAATVEPEGGPLAVFSSAGFFHVAEVAAISVPMTVVANHFYLAPLVESVFEPTDFHILALNRKALRLVHFLRGRCSEVPLPASVPANEESFDPAGHPDHMLRNRSNAGPGHGAMAGVVFGTTTGTEGRREQEHHFYLTVDRGLKEVVDGGLLLLAGVREEVFEYRRAVHHCRLMEGLLEGNPDHMTTAQMATGASEAALAHYHALGEAAMARVREMPDRGRTLEGVREVLKAAGAGRVHQLCAAEDTEWLGDIQHSDTHPHSHEDLVNAAIVETLRYAGEVLMLPKDRLPAGSPLAAILRF